jgi:protein-disulfide isomerase
MAVLPFLAPRPARADDAAAANDPRFAPRTLGSDQAPIKVMEFFSLTCTHCAAFSRETMPEVKAKLIETGKVQMIYRDFPLDRVALMAAMVARTLPPERYEPFVSALFASQDHWAFDRQSDPRDELAKMAGLAGLSRAAFDAAIADKALEQFILAGQQKAEDEYHVDSTPTFAANGRSHAGEMTFAAFSAFIGAENG